MAVGKQNQTLVGDRLEKPLPLVAAASAAGGGLTDVSRKAGRRRPHVMT